ncbi:MAG: nucleoside-diphosphate sugar epimerase/dehydratase [Candidatus Bipolaricaulota bacterium]|nr:nucleoside-diphosphate sugar epimerase/dehydratase [Candidatus Bipolaricaulota bacterium]
MTTSRGVPLWVRRVGILALDALLVALALGLSFWLRFDTAIPSSMLSVFFLSLPIACALKLPIFVVFRLDRLSWKHVDVREAFLIGAASVAGSAAFTLVLFLLREVGVLASFPRSILAIDLGVTFLAVAGVRFSRRLLDEIAARPGRSQAVGVRRALVVGAGDAGAQLVRALEQEKGRSVRVVGFLDDDAHKRGAVVHGIPVVGARGDLARAAEQLKVTSILIAMPSAPRAVVRETVALAREAGIPDVRIVPDLAELTTGQITTAELRELEPTDVLQREEVTIDEKPILRFLGGKRVLVTGAAGSIGSELCRQVLRFGASRLVALDQNETGLFNLEADLRRRFPRADLAVVVADVRDAERMATIFAQETPAVAYHAAAYKHVPMMELYPCEAVLTNVEGTRNVLGAARAAGSEAFVLISTDKAVNPSSIMGASKRVAEALVRDADHDSTGGAAARSVSTRSLAVRFGNVLGSRGSVLGTFQAQVQARQPVTVTHPAMERYFMVTSEAVQLVLEASAVGKSGQVLVLDMGEPVKIVDLARDVIRFYSLEPDVDVPIVYTGVRPGEKLFEELLTAEEGTDKTDFARLFVARMQEPPAAWRADLDILLRAAHADDAVGVRRAIERLVPTYQATTQTNAPQRAQRIAEV